MNNSIGQFSDQAFLAGFHNQVNKILGSPGMAKQAGFTKQAIFGLSGRVLMGPAAKHILAAGPGGIKQPLMTAAQLAMKNNPASVTGLAAMRNVTPTVSQPLRTAAQIAMQKTNPQAIIAANQALSRTAPMMARTGKLVTPLQQRGFSIVPSASSPGQLTPHVLRQLPGRQAIPITRGPVTPGAYTVNMGTPARTLRLTNRATPRTSINIAGRQPVTTTAPAGAGVPPGGVTTATAAVPGGMGPTGQVLGGVGAQPGLMQALAPLGAGMGVGAYWDPFDDPNYDAQMAVAGDPLMA